MLNRYVVNDVVVGALEESRVDSADRANTLGCQAGGEGHGVSLGDSNVEEPIRVSLRKGAGARSTRHCSGDGDDFWILRGQLNQPLPERGSVSSIRDGNLSQFSCRRIVAGRQRVPLLNVLSRREPLPFLRDAMDKAGPFQLLYRRESVHQRVDVMAVDGTEIPEAKLLKENARSEESLHAFLPFPDQRADTGERAGRGIYDGANSGSDAIIQRVSLYRGQILRHRADVGRNRHLVVVEDHDEVALRRTGVVQSFISQTASQSPVAEYRHNLEMLAVQIARDRHPVACGNRGARVTRAESVVLTLGTLEKARESIFLAERFDPIGATRQQLVGIPLVANVPDDLVARSIEYRVEDNRKLDNSQPGADVPTGARADLDEARPHLLRDSAQLISRHRLQVGRRIDAIEN